MSVVKGRANGDGLQEIGKVPQDQTLDAVEGVLLGR